MSTAENVISISASYDAHWRALLEQNPQFANPVPPLSVPRPPDGQHYFNGAEVFGKAVERMKRGEFQLPKANGPLMGPLRGVGDCLYPILEPGDLSYIDTTTPARSGDIVVVKWEPGFFAKQMQSGWADWFAKHGGNPVVAMKYLAEFCGGYQLVVNDGSFGLHDFTGKPNGTILGKVVRIERNGRQIYAPATPMIGLNAATRTYYDFDDLAGTGYGFGTFDLLTITVIPETDCDIELTGTVTCDNISGIEDDGHVIALRKNSTTIVSHGTGTTSKTNSAISALTTASRGVSTDFVLSVSNAVFGSASMHIWAISLRVAVIKR